MHRIPKHSKEYTSFIKLTKELGIKCDGEAHVFAAHLLTGLDLVSLVKMWDEAVKKNPLLFDKYKGLLAKKELEAPKEFSNQINSLIGFLGVRIVFSNIPDNEKEFSEIINEVFSKREIANITVKLHEDNKDHGHVITFWRENGTYYWHDVNSAVQVTEKSSIESLFSTKVTFKKNYHVSYDKTFPIEQVSML